MAKEISQAVVRRLPRYHRYLETLSNEGVERISSSDLSKRMHVTASQIRQDLNNFGGFGQQGYGYNVKYLLKEIGKILGLEDHHTIAVVGAGNLGQALANYHGFNQNEFEITALFDINPRLQGVSINGKPILMMDEFPAFVKEHPVEIAILSVPRDQAVAVAKILTDNGVKAIWNFTYTDLHVPENVVTESVHLTDSLLQVTYRLHENALEDYEEE